MPEIPWEFRQMDNYNMENFHPVRFVVSGDPVPKARPRVTRHGTYTPQRTRDYEEAAGWAYREAGGSLFEGDVGLRMTFWRHTRQRVDLDNLIKGIADGLNGIAWSDDSQIVYLEASKNYGSADPRAEVEVWTWTEP